MLVHNDVSLPPTPQPLNSAMLEFRASEVLALSRLAALQGHAVGYREFERLAQDLDGRALSGVPIASKIVALWHARFPQGRISAPDWPPRPDEVPALWLGQLVAESRCAMLVVLGALTNGALSCLDEDGKPMVLRPEQARLGRLLTLNSDSRSSAETRTQSQALLQQAQDKTMLRAYRSRLILAGLLLSTLIVLVLRWN